MANGDAISGSPHSGTTEEMGRTILAPDALKGTALAALLIAGLYFGRDVLVPIALAVLLSFVLTPLVKRAQDWIRLPRGPAVVVVVALAFGGVASLATLMATQVADLAGNLPRYESTIRDKVKAMRGSAAGAGALERAASVLQGLSAELDKPGAEVRPAGDAGAARPAAQKPLLVEVKPPDPGAFNTLSLLIAPLLHPLATTALVVIFVVFILVSREDLRDRFIRLAGGRDLHTTTNALDDAASRLSRLFLTQLLLNAAFGVIIGLGLWAIGVPSAALWGILAGLLRFVPYIGAFIGAAFPLALAVAVDPGWSMLIWTAALFLIVEPILGHIVEPMVYGHSTGLSPIAIVIATTFWTFLWGPVGLLLATPLTVCLVVIGRHVERLAFLDVILGDRPALSPPERFYQRLLARDPAEAADMAADHIAADDVVGFYDEVALEGLRRAARDAQRGDVDEARQTQILDGMTQVIEAIDDETPPRAADVAADATEPPEAGATTIVPLAAEELPQSWRIDAPVLCVAGQTALDEAACGLLSSTLARHGLGAAVEKARSSLAQNVAVLDPSARRARLVCLSFTDARSAAGMRYAVRRLRRRLPDATIMLCVWATPRGASLDTLRSEARADMAAGSLREAADLARKLVERDAGLDAFAAAPAAEAPREATA